MADIRPKRMLEVWCTVEIPEPECEDCTEDNPEPECEGDELEEKIDELINCFLKLISPGFDMYNLTSLLRCLSEIEEIYEKISEIEIIYEKIGKRFSVPITIQTSEKFLIFAQHEAEALESALQCMLREDVGKEVKARVRQELLPQSTGVRIETGYVYVGDKSSQLD